jgi:hypothetical protein
MVSFNPKIYFEPSRVKVRTGMPDSRYLVIVCEKTAQLRPTDDTRTFQIIKLLVICATPSTTTFAIDTGRIEIYNCSGYNSLQRHAMFPAARV